MLALKHARMGGDPEAIAHVKKEVAIMKVLRGGANILTLRSVAFSGPTNQAGDAITAESPVTQSSGRLSPSASCAWSVAVSMTEVGVNRSVVNTGRRRRHSW